MARLHNLDGGWIPRSNDLDQFLQIDLGHLRAITMVATQGQICKGVSQWVSSYCLWYKEKLTDARWTPYKENKKTTKASTKFSLSYYDKNLSEIII